MSEVNLTIEGIDLVDLYGEQESKLNLLREMFPDVSFTSRGQKLRIAGEKKDVQSAKAKVELLVRMLRDNHVLDVHAIQDVLYGDNPMETKISNSDTSNIIVYGRGGKAIKAKTKNQKRMVTLSQNNDVVFAVGPAGTGKTYTAVALAVQALKNRLVKKIILTRPAVEAGESLGFLPGDLKDKVDPYLRPLYDALDDMLPVEKLNYLMTNRIIEVAPLAFMRGRTLDHAFIILDEAQNCTRSQLKMFLTRLGPSAKCIVTGDLSQIDLPGYQRSGLQHALDILSDLNGIGKIFLDAEDVVRHRLVKEIIRRYDLSDAMKDKPVEKEVKSKSEEE